MSSFKEKSQAFIMGLMAGLIIAGAFFILKLDNYFKELNFYKNIVKTFKSDSKEKETIVITDNAAPLKEKKIRDNSKKKSVQLNDSSGSEKLKTDFILNADTLSMHSPKDSTGFNNAVVQEDIVIRKDELFLTKTIEIINLNPALNQNNSKDSLLHKVSGVKDDKNQKQFINIELWQSPLNYKGYKMGKYKVVLYGITSLEGLKIFAIENNIYLKHGTIVYNLENTSEFKPYERVTDENIINKLK